MSSPIDIVAVARDFALQVHSGQLYGDKPYRVHLEAAVEVLRRFGFLQDEVVAGVWLHDTKEDRGVTDAQLAGIGMPPLVIAIVDGVTDEPGATRKERKAKTYGKTVILRESVTANLADRIANVEAGGKIQMYRDEHAAFRKALYRREHGIDILWEHLDGLLAA